MVVIQRVKSMISVHHGRKMGNHRSAWLRRENKKDTNREGKEKEERKDKGRKKEREFIWKKQIKKTGS